MSIFYIRDNKGFSLMEILVAASIIVLLAGISIPYLRKYQPNLKLNATARGLTSDMRLAQQLTVTEQVVHIVDFNLVNDAYNILRLGDATTTIKSIEFDPEVSWQQITGLTDNQVSFNFYGGVRESGQLSLINTNNKTATINIKPSGYIQLE